MNLYNLFIHLKRLFGLQFGETVNRNATVTVNRKRRETVNRSALPALLVRT